VTQKKLTRIDLQRMKEKKEPVVWVTSYEHTYKMVEGELPRLEKLLKKKET